MPKSNDDEKNKYPPNLFKRADSWILDFYFRKERYTENLGSLSRTAAKEIRDKRKGEVAAGTRAVNGKKWIGRQWILDVQPLKVENPLFEVAKETYLAWYKANREPASYARHFYAAKPLTEFFSGKRLDAIAPFDVEKYKLQRKAPARNPRPSTANCLFSGIYSRRR
jgi:hypothetical protein